MEERRTSEENVGGMYPGVVAVEKTLGERESEYEKSGSCRTYPARGWIMEERIELLGSQRRLELSDMAALTTCPVSSEYFCSKVRLIAGLERSFALETHQMWLFLNEVRFLIIDADWRLVSCHFKTGRMLLKSFTQSIGSVLIHSFITISSFLSITPCTCTPCAFCQQYSLLYRYDTSIDECA